MADNAWVKGAMNQLLYICIFIGVAHGAGLVYGDGLDEFYDEIDLSVRMGQLEYSSRLYHCDGPLLNPVQEDALLSEGRDYFYCIGLLAYHEFCVSVSEYNNGERQFYLLTFIDIPPFSDRLFRPVEPEGYRLEIPAGYAINWKIRRYDVFLTKEDVLEVEKRTSSILKKPRRVFKDGDYPSEGTLYWRWNNPDGQQEWRMGKDPYAEDALHMWMLTRFLMDYASGEFENEKGFLEAFKKVDEKCKAKFYGNVKKPLSGTDNPTHPNPSKQNHNPLKQIPREAQP